MESVSLCFKDFELFASLNQIIHYCIQAVRNANTGKPASIFYSIFVLLGICDVFHANKQVFERIVDFEIRIWFDKGLIAFVYEWTSEAYFFFLDGQGGSDGFSVFDDFSWGLLWFVDWAWISDKVFELFTGEFVE